MVEKAFAFTKRQKKAENVDLKQEITLAYNEVSNLTLYK